MKTTYISDEIHKKLKLVCVEKNVKITEIVDEIINHVFNTGVIDKIASIVSERKKEV